MGQHCLLHKIPGAPSVGFVVTSEAAPDFVRETRVRLWELSPSLHCSIVGTCLTAGELRQFFVRRGDPDARTASDHALHARGVRAASQRDDGGKQLQKALDRRHEAALRRFARTESAQALRALWSQALDEGEIAGPYWAVLTHPLSNQRLAQDVFGDVHMLSHQVGAAARLDIARLRRLERDIAERDDKILRQEARLRAAAREREALAANLAELRLAQAAQSVVRPEADAAAADLARELASERARAAALTEKLRLSEAARARSESAAAAAQTELREVTQELQALEATLRADPADATATALDSGLRGRKVLYVGGRPGLIGQLGALARTHGAEWLAHDGGVDDNLALLPGFVSQADMVVFPVDCVSHSAAEQVKKLCARLGKPWRALRTASVASFIAHIDAAPAPRERWAAAAE